MTEAVDRDSRPWWLRLRSTLALVVLVAGLGVALAAGLGLVGLALGALFDQALG